jgi:bifunctional DNA-binding transcriptional regulator/antitoxin component of YhaV-PrlF toxin-antitoxin module
MGIKKGDKLILIQKGNKIVLEKSEEIVEKLEDKFKDIKEISEYSLKKLWLNRSDDVWNQYLDEI